jgi:hypothetical protein
MDTLLHIEEDNYQHQQEIFVKQIKLCIKMWKLIFELYIIHCFCGGLQGQWVYSTIGPWPF